MLRAWFRHRSEYRPIQKSTGVITPQLSYPFDYFSWLCSPIYYRFLCHFVSLLRRLLSPFLFLDHIISCIGISFVSSLFILSSIFLSEHFIVGVLFSLSSSLDFLFVGYTHFFLDILVQPCRG